MSETQSQLELIGDAAHDEQAVFDVGPSIDAEKSGVTCDRLCGGRDPVLNAEDTVPCPHIANNPEHAIYGCMTCDGSGVVRRER